VLVLAVILSIGVVTFGLLGVLAIALIRHIKLLSASMGAFQRDVQPILEQLRVGSAESQQRLSKLQERGKREAG